MTRVFHRLQMRPSSSPTLHLLYLGEAIALASAPPRRGRISSVPASYPPPRLSRPGGLHVQPPRPPAGAAPGERSPGAGGRGNGGRGGGGLWAVAPPARGRSEGGGANGAGGSPPGVGAPPNLLPPPAPPSPPHLV